MATVFSKEDGLCLEIITQLFTFPTMANGARNDEEDSSEPNFEEDASLYDLADEWENYMSVRSRHISKKITENQKLPVKLLLRMVSPLSMKKMSQKKRSIMITFNRLSKQSLRSSNEELPSAPYKGSRVISLSDPRNVLRDIGPRRRVRQMTSSRVEDRSWADAIVPELGLTHRQIEELQSRELTPEDYDILLQLAECVPQKKFDENAMNNICRELQINTSEEICVICMDIMSKGSKISELVQCHHRFHSPCIKTWLTEFGTHCPLDGQSLQDSEANHEKI